MPDQDWFAQFEATPQGNDDWFGRFAEPSQAKSVGGFMKNVVTSGVDTAKGMLSLLNPRNWDDIARTVAEQQRQREKDVRADLKRGDGAGVDSQRLKAQGQQFVDMAYEDPVGLATAFATGGRKVVGLRPIKGGLQDAGVRTMRGALKSRDTELKTMPGASQAGLDRMSDEVARTALTERVNPMTRRGADTLQTRIEALDAVRNTDIAAAPQQVISGSGTRQLNALRPIVAKYRNQSTPEADVKAIADFGREMTRNPAMTKYGGPGKRRMRALSPNELNQLNKGDNKALSGKFGKVGDAEIDARRAVVAERRAMLDEAVPGTRDVGQRMNKLINLRNVSNVARKRGEGRDPIGITDMISLSSGRPSTLLLSTAMRPAVQASIGGSLYRTGSALPSEIDMAGLQRLALMALLTKKEGQDR